MAPVAVQEFATPPLTLAADARLADVLVDCGIRSPHCLGVIALAGADAVNQAIAIDARVLNPGILIVARAKSTVAKVNLQSFGGVAVINPFETFAYNVGVALRAPEMAQIEDWLTATDGTPLPPAVQPPRGRWVLVGFGRFGRAIAEVLDDAGIEWKAFDPRATGGRDQRLVHGDYTENILHDAGVESADVLVAGADSDAVNLGATTLARRVKPDIFVVIRQNQMQDRALVEAARANIKFVQSDIMVNECLQVLKTPMLSRFISRLRAGDREQASAVLAHVRREVGDGSPHSWAFECDVLQPGMFFAFFQRPGASFRIQQLMADPTNPGTRMRVTPLMIERDGTHQLLPPEDMPLKPGDRILFAGDDVARRLQKRYLTEPGTVAWVCSGSEPARGFIFRWWEQRRRASAAQ